MKRLALFLLTLTLAGCSVMPGPAQPVTYYVLPDPGPVAASGQVHPGVLLLREMDASSFYQARGLAYSREPGTRAHYQFAQWAELPARRLTWLLRQRLEESGIFATVAPLGGGVIGDYQLNTRLVDFYHDASTRPGSVRLLLDAELVNRAQGRLLARQAFLVQLPVSSYDANGAAEAMGRAANQMVDEIAVWLAQASR